jgi:hypothetical protein
LRKSDWKQIVPSMPKARGALKLRSPPSLKALRGVSTMQT